MREIIGTTITIPDTKIPPDLSVFTPEKCDNVRDWFTKHGIPIIIPNDTWKACKHMYKELKQRRIFWQRRSDEIAMFYFGMTNEQIYRRLKSHFENDGKISADDTIVHEDVNVLNEYGLLESMCIVTNQLSKPNLGNVDIYRLQQLSNYFLPKHIDPSLLVSYDIFFTPDEIYALQGSYSDKIKEEGFNYKAWLEEYNLIFNGVAEKEKFMSLGLERVKLLQKFNLEPDDDIVKESMLRLGWNPELSFNDDNRKLAYNRLLRIQTESTKNIDLVDLSEFVKNTDNQSIEETAFLNNMKPVFIVFKRTLDSTINNIISRVTKSFWAHAAISFDPNLHNMYTFDMFHHGFTRESIYNYPKGTVINVLCCFCNIEAYNRIHQEISKYRRNKKHTSYGFQNFITCLTRKANENTKSMVCSNFVDYMLKIGEISPTKDSWSTIHPGRLRRAIASDKKRRFYDLYKGPIEEYNPNKVLLYLSKCSSNKIRLNEDKAVDNLTKETEELYKKIVEPYIGMEVINEAPKMEINDNGDLIIYQKDIDYEKEYQKSHILLEQYNESNNINGMKWELAKLWYMNNRIEEDIKKAKKESDRKNLIDTRSRIMNDFHKYMKVVLKSDKNFNFDKYYKSTPYADYDKIKIKKSSLQYTIDNVRRFIFGR